MPIQTPLTFPPVAVLLLVGAYRELTVGVARCFGDNPVPTTGTRREQAVVADLVGSWWRDQGDEALDQLTLLHQDVGGAVASLFQALLCKGRARDVAAQALEPGAIAGGHAHVGMKAHAAVPGHAR